MEILKTYLQEINTIYKELKFNNPEIKTVAYNIVKLCSNNLEVKISKSGESELLIYTKNNGRFSNLLIDEDCDISYIYIGKHLDEAKSKFYPFKDGFNYEELVSKLV